MSDQQSTAIIIPARLASKRLPNKPLLEINSKTMIEHVWENAINSQLGTVIVATDSQEIIDVIQRRNGIACMTSENHQSGTDRIYEALNFFDQNQAIEKVINLQGDLPTIDQFALKEVLNLLDSAEVDIGTLVAPFKDFDEMQKAQYVKAECHFKSNNIKARANNFTRIANKEKMENLYHHVGIYSYRREALEKFVKLKQTNREKEEKLEQLRAIENNMHIEVSLINSPILGIDTQEDLDNIREIQK